MDSREVAMHKEISATLLNELHEFAIAVKVMRDLQKEYGAWRKLSVWHSLRDQEQLVDSKAKDILDCQQRDLEL